MSSPSSLRAATAALVEPLARREGRPAAARKLAEHLGAEDLAVFVWDHTVGLRLPAPGFPQTLPRGVAWRDFIARCDPRTVVEDRLPWPGLSGDRRVVALSDQDRSVLVLIGGRPRMDEALSVVRQMPLLAATFHAEREAIAGEGQAAAAAGAARQAQALAAALTRAQADLQAALRELQEGDRRKDEFLATLAHELRNPLAGLVNALHMLRQPQTSAEVRRDAAEIAERQAGNLGRLVDGLMDVSRIKLGKVELALEPVDVAALVARVIDAQAPAVRARNHRLTSSLPGTPVWVSGDVVRLEQIVSNLLGNAVKYTDAGGHIAVALARDGAHAVLAVRDDGVGLAPELLPRVFEPFVQAEQSLARSEGGLGIGLMLVRSLVELHGGSVAARSDGPGRGSEFVVHLPAIERSAEAQPKPVAPVFSRATRPRRVLVVDDNADSAQMLAEAIRLWGHEVRVASDGPAALAAVDVLAPDIVLLDIGLPGMSGYEVAERLRQTAGGGPTLVALTGYGQAEDRERARTAGFDHHVVKPVDLDRLRVLVAEAGDRPPPPR